MTLQLGLNTFGDLYPGPDGRMLSGAQVIRNVVAEATLADRVGLTAELSGALSRRGFVPGHDRGQVLVDVATIGVPRPALDKREMC